MTSPRVTTSNEETEALVRQPAMVTVISCVLPAVSAAATRPIRRSSAASAAAATVLETPTRMAARRLSRRRPAAIRTERERAPWPRLVRGGTDTLVKGTCGAGWVVQEQVRRCAILVSAVTSIVFLTPSLPLPFGRTDARWLHAVLPGLHARGFEVTCLSCTGETPDRVAEAEQLARSRGYSFRHVPLQLGESTV